MRIGFIVALLLNIASISSAAILFLDNKPSSSVKVAPQQTAVEIKWGIGSEADMPLEGVRR